MLQERTLTTSTFTFAPGFKNDKLNWSLWVTLKASLCSRGCSKEGKCYLPHTRWGPSSPWWHTGTQSAWPDQYCQRRWSLKRAETCYSCQLISDVYKINDKEPRRASWIICDTAFPTKARICSNLHLVRPIFPNRRIRLYHRGLLPREHLLGCQGNKEIPSHLPSRFHLQKENKVSHFLIYFMLQATQATPTHNKNCCW